MKLIRRLLIISLMLILSISLAFGCTDQTAPPPENNNSEEAVIPEEIEEWVEYSRSIFLAQERQYEGTHYLLVTYGEKTTGGYSAEITDIKETDDKITVTVNFSQPEEGEPVTQAITYPYDLKEMKPSDLPVEFIAEGDETYIPTLIGLDILLPIAAHSGGIAAFSPKPQAIVPGEFELEGISNVFEGTLQYRLSDSDGEKLDSGFATGAMGDWGYFEEAITVPQNVESGEKLLLELYWESPKDGSVQDLIQIDLQLE